MADRQDDDAISFEALSALVDNEATERDINRACGAWRDQPSARERWHNYQLIGDVMRSEGLARASSSDADFLAAVRGRLDQAPAVLAPTAVVVPPAEQLAVSDRVVSLADARALRHRRWAGPMSVAAGFVLVLSAAVTTLNNGGLTPSMQGVPVAQGVPATSVGTPALAQAFNGQDMALANGALPAGLKAGLTADGSADQQLASSAVPTFNENLQGAHASGRVGYLVYMRDDQLDQLMAAQRMQGAQGARSLASPQGTVQTVSFGNGAP